MAAASRAPDALVVGDIEAARLTCTALGRHGARTQHLLRPSDGELRAALATGVDAVAILVRGDVSALRYALLVAHLRPGVRLMVTMFDRTLGEELQRAVPTCTVTSPADIAVPAVIGACLGQEELAVYGHAGAARAVRDTSEGPVVVERPAQPRSLRRFALSARSQLRPQDDASRVLLGGLLGLAVILVADWLLGILFLHETVVGSLYGASRVVATVGPGADEEGSPQWYLVVSSLLMLAAIALAAVFTAGVVNRLLSRRTIALVGRRTLPLEDHVVVVGLGQVGLRLAATLRSLDVPTLVVEREPLPANLAMAKAARIPVLVGPANEPAVMVRANLARARALAAMGSRDLDNVEVAITARAVAPATPVVVRAGEDDVIAETRSLFAIGEVRDVPSLTAAAVTLALLGRRADVVYARGTQLCAHEDGVEVPVALGPRCRC